MRKTYNYLVNYAVFPLKYASQMKDIEQLVPPRVDHHAAVICERTACLLGEFLARSTVNVGNFLVSSKYLVEGKINFNACFFRSIRVSPVQVGTVLKNVCSSTMSSATATKRTKSCTRGSTGMSSSSWREGERKP